MGQSGRRAYLRLRQRNSSPKLPRPLRESRATVRLGRRNAATSDVLNERLTRIRLTIENTNEKNVSARTLVFWHTAVSGQSRKLRRANPNVGARLAIRSSQSEPMKTKERQILRGAAARRVLFAGLGFEGQ